MFYGVDPLAEKRNWISPYNYVQNNPLNRIDPDGRIDYPLRGHFAVNKEDYKNGAWGLPNAIVRTSLFMEIRNIGTSPHIGIDYRASIGTPVYNLGDGTVANRGTMRNGIIYITIEYLNGDQLRFLHLDRIAEDMDIGSEVFEGQIIGYAGNSGQYRAKDGTMKNYQPHLHVDAIDRDGNPINPEKNKYGVVSNQFFFDELDGDYLKLINMKEEGIRIINEAGGIYNE